MKLTKSYTLPVSRQRAWEALNDTTVLCASIPGCDSIEAEGDNAYAVSMSASIGPVTARFKGHMQLTDIDAPRTYTIVFEGQGGAAGFGKGNAHVTLEADGDSSTKLSYTATAQVGGNLAQIGSLLVDGVARTIAGEFFKRLGAQLTGAGKTGRAAADDDATSENHAPAVRTEPGADGDGEETKRKESWTAWISKS